MSGTDIERSNKMEGIKMLEKPVTVVKEQQNKLYNAMLDEQSGENMLRDIIKECQNKTLRHALTLVQQTLHKNSGAAFGVFNEIFLGKD